MITPRQLLAFQAVAEELHFGRAAERLHTSQPPVSQAVRKLEAELGVDLLIRTTRSVQLTAAGEVFHAHAARVLSLLTQSRSVAQAGARGERGRLRVGLTGVTAVRLFSHQARAFRDLYPGLDLEMTPFAYSGEQEDALLSGAIDVGFLMHDVPQSELTTQQVWAEPLVVVLPDSHPLAASPALTLRELRDEPFITFPEGQGSELRSALMAACAVEGFRPRVARETSPPYMLLAFVSAGEGVTVLPESTAAQQVYGLAIRRLRGLENGARTFMAWRTSDSSPVVENFLRHAREFHPIQP